MRAAKRAKMIATAVGSSDEETLDDGMETPVASAMFDDDLPISLPSFQTEDAEAELFDDATNSSSSDDNEADVHELLRATDANYQRKIYHGSSLSIYDAGKAIIKLARRLNLDKTKTNILLHGIRALLPDSNKLSRTLAGLMKILRLYFVYYM